MKDVAGLVPGAYKGRGKGNRFLADLCDADVLVHVLDVTGQADADGNIVTPSHHSAIHSSELLSSSQPSSLPLFAGSGPSEDAKWIREELHRWIHANIRAKWAMVSRKGADRALDQLAALLSGYHGNKSLIESAVQRSKLNVAESSNWSLFDTHRLVAHYLSIRFPICLALNKVNIY